MTGLPPTGSVTFDDSLWPLMVVRLTGELSPQQAEDYLSRSTQFMQRQERHALIFDVSTLGQVSSEQRQRQVEWLKQNEALMRQTVLGIAYVVTSPLVRLTMGVIFHFKPPPVPYTIVSRLDAAGAWAARCLEEAGLHAPAERVRQQFGPRPEAEGQ
ncbi:hypothetical protein ACN28E_14655 [Archangium lansingense]|uniref:hypothetical protein n=1 Tax=Archangium lansingense TaxID=2995310 RepID=UPI003B7C63E5